MFRNLIMPTVSIFCLGSSAVAVAQESKWGKCDVGPDWPQCGAETQSVTPVRADRKPASGQSASAVISKFDRTIRELNSAVHIDASEQHVLSKNLSAIVGKYVRKVPAADGKTKFETVAGQADPKLNVTAIKDDFLYRGIVTKSFNAGVKIPALSVTLDSKDIAELEISYVSEAASTLSANQIACNFPLGEIEKAKTTEYAFITSATVVKIRRRFFKEGGGGASGTFPIINFEGKAYHSDNEEYATYLVLINPDITSPATLELCKAYGIIQSPKKEEPEPKPPKVAEHKPGYPQKVSGANDPLQTKDTVISDDQVVALEKVIENQEKFFGAGTQSVNITITE